MKVYLLAFAAPWLAIFALGVGDAWAFMSHAAGNWLPYAATVVGVPVGAAWIIAELGRWARPGRTLQRGPVGRVLAGGLAAVGAIALVMVTWATVGWQWNEAIAMGSASAAVSIAVFFMPGRRARPGCCVACGYSLAGLPGDRCPECGRVHAGEVALDRGQAIGGE